MIIVAWSVYYMIRLNLMKHVNHFSGKNIVQMPSGCKFSAEEERVVIELQADFGNKWAKIARYLPGRTDNDVKNFWSARRKRLERILQSPTPTPKSQKNKGKDPVLHEMTMMEVRN